MAAPKYSPNFDVTDVAIPGYLTSFQQSDPLQAYDETIQRAQQALAIEKAREADAAVDAIQEASFTLGGDQLDSEIENLLLQQGQLDTLSKLRETRSRIGANDMLTNQRQASMIEELQAIEDATTREGLSQKYGLPALPAQREQDFRSVAPGNSLFGIDPITGESQFITKTEDRPEKKGKSKDDDLLKEVQIMIREESDKISKLPVKTKSEKAAAIEQGFTNLSDAKALKAISTLDDGYGGKTSKPVETIKAQNNETRVKPDGTVWQRSENGWTRIK